MDRLESMLVVAALLVGFAVGRLSVPDSTAIYPQLYWQARAEMDTCLDRATFVHQCRLIVRYQP